MGNSKLLQVFKDEGLKEKYRIDLESHENHIIIISRGKASHGSTPEAGENAIANMILYLNEILDFQDSFTMFLKDFSTVNWKGL
ncbi:peptidase dimerization domain-containing protein [Clostridium sp. KNHs214]|uniref:peptidase dimerization domain-containing protein n=1 Tax=Clostridium sp. KNHs214 TaxID=1540257 RepID=UPI00163A739E|nr:peptidase dimerization domain-containing protein [Clostridium sp. KNHs214]